MYLIQVNNEYDKPWYLVKDNGHIYSVTNGTVYLEENGPWSWVLIKDHELRCKLFEVLRSRCKDV